MNPSPSRSSTSSSSWAYLRGEHRDRVAAEDPSAGRLDSSRHSTSIFGSSPAAVQSSAPAAPSSVQQNSSDDGPSSGRSIPGRQPSPVLKEQQYGAESSMPVDARRLPRVEKDADDPTTPPSSTRGARRTQSTTLTTLSRLFAVQAATSPEHSRNPSYVLPSLRPESFPRCSQAQPSLPDHLYTRGLLHGRHSDITVHAFGHAYKLHRLILDRAPFFASALSEPWLEANEKEMTVHPEDIDSSITQAAFELGLKRLYGCYNLEEEDEEPMGLFATGCWLEMQDLVDSAIESMLRQMTPETLAPLIRLVTNNYYGRSGDKILASAKSMLCRDGSRMDLKRWDGIPGDIIREIVGGDGFFIDNEWDRFVLAKRILDRRLKLQAIAAGLIDPLITKKVEKIPNAANLMALRFDTVYRKHSAESGRGVPDHLYRWISLYTNPDVEPLLVLLDEGIHYVHLDFEQLQYIRRTRDYLGLPVLPEKIISNALWQQMELRQKVMNARENDLELGLSVQCTEDTALDASREATLSIAKGVDSSRAKGKRKARDTEEEKEEIESGSWDGNGKPRKFWIPSSDCNIVMGGNAEPIIATSNNTTMQRHASRLSATTIQPEDVQWAADFAAATSQPRASLDAAVPGTEVPPTVNYSHLPPFRFAAEFPHPRLLKERKREYSRTVFYAGSLWNIYIQKVASSRSKQLGVYLHRVKEKETEEVIAGTAGLAQGSVDERIGQLDREMILRNERHDRINNRRLTVGPDGDGADSSGGAAVDDDSHLSPGGSSGAERTHYIRNFLRRKNGQTDILATSSPSPTFDSDGAHSVDSPQESEDSETERLTQASDTFHVPTLPPYVDVRPTIKTYFKIYSPSRGGRMLSVYESAPDNFNFSQSWGWKSSTLMLDEGLLSDDMDDGKDDVEALGERKSMRGKGDGKLRFMVVIGNV